MVQPTAASKQGCMNAMTIDVEDYFHVAAFFQTIQQSEWDNWPCRVEQNTNRILEIFDEANLTGTFFVLGWVAERYPELVKKIDKAGHEIASHGYSHQLIYKQDPQVFKEETHKSKTILEDITGKPILGYRAASYSITAKSLWALDTLAELGFTWDSSIFPTHHDTYGIAGSPEAPYTIKTSSGATLTEFPLTTAKFGKHRVPAAGGGYFRQYPYALSKWLFSRASEQGERAMIFYLHPWEIDPDQPRVPNAKWFSRFRHYTNLDKCEGRLQRMIRDFDFTTVSDVLAQSDVSQQVAISDLA